MTYLLHALSKSPCSHPPKGLRGEDLLWLDAGDLGAWASFIPGSETQGEDALEHHRVVEQICECGPCLPLRFRTVLGDGGELRRLLEESSTDLRAALERLGLRREVAVTLLWLSGQAVAESMVDSISGAGAGRQFLESKRRAQAFLDERRGVAAGLAASLEEALAIEQGDARHAICPSASVALSSAILVSADGAGQMKSEVERVAARLGGVRAVVSGPWPPYTFAQSV